MALIDIDLPGLNGYEVARATRQRLDDSIHLIAMTGHGQQRDIEAAREAGFNDHLLKPIDYRRLTSLFNSRQAKADGRLAPEEVAKS